MQIKAHPATLTYSKSNEADHHRSVSIVRWINHNESIEAYPAVVCGVQGMTLDPGHPEKLRLKVTHRDRKKHGYIDLCLRLTTYMLKSAHLRAEQRSPFKATDSE